MASMLPGSTRVALNLYECVISMDPPLPHYKLLIPNGYIYISGRSRPISPSRAFSIRYEKIIIGSSTMFRSCFLHLTPIVRMGTLGIHKIPWQYYSPDAEVRHACLPLRPQIRVNFIFQSFIEIFFHIHRRCEWRSELDKAKRHCPLMRTRRSKEVSGKRNLSQGVE